MAPWHLVETESDPNKAWDIWKQIFTCIADSNAPLKKKRVRGISASWITPELKHDLFGRDRLKKVAYGLEVMRTGLTTNKRKTRLIVMSRRQK